MKILNYKTPGPPMPSDPPPSRIWFILLVLVLAFVILVLGGRLIGYYY